MKTIAEISSNFQTKEDCLTSIRLASKARSWAVKFQLFSIQDLYGPFNKAVYHPGESPFLDPNWLKDLYYEANQYEIEFMCTAFSQRNYEFVNEFVNVHKIASAELTDTGILSTVNSFKKPVILSTGGSSLDEISHALMYLKDCKVTIMYCVADYPARVVDLRQLQVLKNNFGDAYEYGFSDHTQDLYAIPYMAKLTGASVIEKHCNLAGVVKSDDAAHSISYKDLDFMNYAIQNDPSPARISEFTSTSMRSMWKRRFVATREINQGDRLLLGVNVDIYRTQVASKDPVLTFRPNDIQGKTCLIFKKPGDPICYGDYEIEIE